ncbi:MAG: hypothetical protein ACD_65C00223G0003 [uncultured bacterium]|nr:MAG: hypothetical protein ACD_65C00223G0003 [uncultured bacterium]
MELDNGSHEIYVIAKDADGITAETSGTVSITIDTEAAALDYITIDPAGSITAGDTFTVEIFSEPDLQQVGVLLDDKIYELRESLTTNGVYEGTLAAPYEEGVYNLDVILVDMLANEIQYSDQAVINVVAGETGNATEPPEGGEETLTEEEKTTATAPSDVAGVEAINGSGRVTLTWEAAGTGSQDVFIDHYKVYYGPDPELLYSTAETFDSSTTWYIPNLANEITYYFEVTAIDSEGNESLGKSIAVAGTPEPEEEEGLGTLHDVAGEPSIEETGTPEETPASGPSPAWILLFTLVFTQSYFGIKKKLVRA